MTLNDLERRNCPYFAFFSPNLIASLANYVTVVKDRPVMSVKSVVSLPLLAIINPPCSAVFFATAELLVTFRLTEMCDEHMHTTRHVPWAPKVNTLKMRLRQFV